jgi:predicted RNA-binding Zn-ribbon protein involved in translation (DUF1610 family)
LFRISGTIHSHASFIKASRRRHTRLSTCQAIGEANVEEASAMIVQSACQSATTRVLATEDLSRPKCPDCGSILLIAEESRFNLRGRIDHAWSCDACGSAFVTSIRLRRREPARQRVAYPSDPVE